MQTSQILIVEDEEVTREMLKTLLESEGYIVYTANDGTGMANILSKEKNINLIMMDIQLPGKNGLLLARELLHEQKNMGLIFLTSRKTEIDIVLGLEIGADDYIVKPFNPRELTIRTRNLLARLRHITTHPKKMQTIEGYLFNGWKLDINRRALMTPEGVVYRLPRSEFRALLHFCENPGKIHSREELLKKMTGRQLKLNDRTVDVTIRRIRKHFENCIDRMEIIATIHGEGYRFCADIEAIQSAYDKDMNEKIKQ